MHLVALGLNHKTAPVEVRERFSISRDNIIKGLKNLPHYQTLDEAVVLYKLQSKISRINNYERLLTMFNDIMQKLRDAENTHTGEGLDRLVSDYIEQFSDGLEDLESNILFKIT